MMGAMTNSHSPSMSRTEGDWTAERQQWTRSGVRESFQAKDWGTLLTLAAAFCFLSSTSTWAAGAGCVAGTLRRRTASPTSAPEAKAPLSLAMLELESGADATSLGVVGNPRGRRKSRSEKVSQ